MSGTVNVSRTLWDDEAFASEAFSEREAWVWMICEASWKPRKKRVGDFIISLERGQLAASVRFMADAFGWHRNKAHRFIQRLAKLDMITVETGTGVNVITICKYDKYQNEPKAGGTGAGQERDRSGTNENKGEIREEGKKEDTDVSLSLPVPANDVSEAVARYNDAAEKAGWPQVQKLNPNRSKQLRARLAECGGLEGWEVALRKAFDSDFLRGRTPKPWLGFGFDWLVKTANFTKLMEGNYDNRDSNPGSNGSSGSGGMAAAFGAVAARRSAAARRSGGHGGGSF